MGFEKLVRSSVKEIKKYVPGKSIEEIALIYNLDPEKIIKLGSNENPLGPSPKAMEVPIGRVELSTLLEAEMQRPAANRLEIVRERRQRRGISMSCVTWQR